MNPVALFATIRLNLLRQPLMKPETVEGCLNIERRKLIQMIESGELAWAWNISAGGKRNIEPRILTHCVVERQTGIIHQIGATKNLKLPDVVNLILPRERQTMRGRELQKLFLCQADHVRHLHKAGELEMVPETLPKHGPNASPRFTRASLVRFLTIRRIA
jgi:hypothetical protein